MPPNDPFPIGSEPPYSARNAFLITPSDTAELAMRPWAIDCRTSGEAAMVMENGVEITVQLNAGYPYPIRPTIVKAAGTTATGLFGLF